MKKNVGVVIFILFTAFQSSAYVYSMDNSPVKTTVRHILPKVKKTKVGKNYKRNLKKHIKKRKKYHRELLKKYNASFHPKYLEAIEENSHILRALRKQYNHKM